MLNFIIYFSLLHNEQTFCIQTPSRIPGVNLIVGYKVSGINQVPEKKVNKTGVPESYAFRIMKAMYRK